MDKGHYYSFEGTGSKVWELIVDSHEESEIYKYFSGNYRGDKEHIQKTIVDFLAIMESEELIRRNNDDEIPAPVDMLRSDEEKEEMFTDPAFQKFTDMEDLLLLDPIHDVDESGWPSLKN